MSAFLDDQLYAHVINKELTGADDFKQLLNELFRICENYWKPKFDLKTMGKRDLKILLDRTFNGWDLFIKKLIKDKYFLVDVIDKYSYKKIFMENPDFKKIYEES